MQILKDYWKSNLISNAVILFAIVILMVLKTVFAIQEANKFGTFISKKTVVRLNDSIVVNKRLYNDTVNIYVNSQIIDSSGIFIDTTENATVILDTTLIDK